MLGQTRMTGQLGVRHLRAPRASLGWKLGNLRRVVPGLFKWQVSKAVKAPTMLGSLRVRACKANGEVTDYGLVSTKVVTTAFVNDMVDELIAETTTWGDYKYHDSGVGTTAAVVGDTDIETTDGESRVAGTQVEASANVYRSVGTIAYTTTKAITEHGLFNAATVGTLMDRHVFSAINVENGDSIQFTYELTCTAGG